MTNRDDDVVRRQLETCAMLKRTHPKLARQAAEHAILRSAQLAGFKRSQISRAMLADGIAKVMKYWEPQP